MTRDPNARGTTMLAARHDMAFLEKIATRVTVLQFGRIFAEGTISEIIEHRGVQEFYLGAADA